MSEDCDCMYSEYTCFESQIRSSRRIEMITDNRSKKNYCMCFEKKNYLENCSQFAESTYNSKDKIFKYSRKITDLNKFI